MFHSQTIKETDLHNVTIIEVKIEETSEIKTDPPINLEKDHVIDQEKEKLNLDTTDQGIQFL